jgi:hypothetical protein
MGATLRDFLSEGSELGKPDLLRRGGSVGRHAPSMRP